MTKHKTLHKSSASPTDAPEWQIALRRFLADNQPIIFGVCAAVLLGLIFIFVGQWYRQRDLQAAEKLAYAKTAADFEEISERFKRAPAAPLALLRAARLHYKNGSFRQALETYDRFLAVHADHSMAETAVLGQWHCYEAMGRIDEALRGYENFLRDYPQNPLRLQAMLGKARCLDALGRTAEAKAVYEKFIDENPDSRWRQDAEQALSDLERRLRILQGSGQYVAPELSLFAFSVNIFDGFVRCGFFPG